MIYSQFKKWMEKEMGVTYGACGMIWEIERLIDDDESVRVEWLAGKAEEFGQRRFGAKKYAAQMSGVPWTRR